MKLESLGLDKFKKNEVKDLNEITGGRVMAIDPETGCCDAPDCSTPGPDGGDSYPDDSNPCGQ